MLQFRVTTSPEKLSSSELAGDGAQVGGMMSPQPVSIQQNELQALQQRVALLESTLADALQVALEALKRVPAVGDPNYERPQVSADPNLASQHKNRGPIRDLFEELGIQPMTRDEWADDI